MRRLLLATAVTAVITTIVTSSVGSMFGLFKSAITDSQVARVARVLVDDPDYRSVLLDRMRDSGQFSGPRGEQGVEGGLGPAGEAGPPGPMPVLRCLSVIAEKKSSVECPIRYVLTGCAVSRYGLDTTTNQRVEMQVNHDARRCRAASVSGSKEFHPYWVQAGCCALYREDEQHPEATHLWDTD